MTPDPDLSRAHWVKSSYSNGNEGECVEVAPGVVAASGLVPVRDSKDPRGPALLFTPAAWSSLMAALRRGEFPRI